MTENPGDKATIVVIDDEESMCQGCRQVLEDAGYCAYATTDALRGVTLVKEMKPKVVLVDLKMPEMSGMEVLKEVRGIDDAIVPVVITGYGTIDSAVEAMKIGAYDYLCKPFDDTALLVTTNRAVEKYHLAKRLALLEHEKKTALNNFTTTVCQQLQSPIKDTLQRVHQATKQMASPLTAKQRWMMEQASERLARLVRMIEDWLKLARVEAGEGEHERKSVEIAPVIEDAWRAIPDGDGRERIDFDLNAKDDVRPMLGNENLLRELFTDLLRNSVTFTSGPGRITVNVTTQGPNTVVSITDSGIEIPEHELPYLFEPFYGGVRAGVRRKPGFGFRLAIAKKIVLAHGGTITANSVRGQGATLVIALPTAG